MKGSIRHRGASWTFQHEVTRNGKRAFITGTRRTKKQAETALAESLTAYEKGEHIEPTKVTVAVYLRDWLDLIKPRLKPGTFRSYHDIVEHRLIPHLGDARLSELRPARIARCYAELRTSGRRNGNGGLSETSIEHTHRTLHAVSSRLYGVEGSVATRRTT